MLFASSTVFDHEDDAKLDAVRTLNLLTCCSDSPLASALKQALKWVIDEKFWPVEEA